MFFKIFARKAGKNRALKARKKLPLLTLCALFIVAAPACAQISIHSSVDKTSVALNDQIALTVTVSGSEASLPEPQMPSLPNFSVYSSGRNQSISFVNGRVSSSIVHTYVLEPRFVGKGIIGPITLSGTNAQTAAIEIQVVKPDGSNPQTAAGSPQRPQPRIGAEAPNPGGRGPDLFVKASLDKPKAFVNEQVTLSIKFFTAVNLLGNPQYFPPKISGFLAEDLPPVRQGNTTLNGRVYYVSEVKTALFAAQSGKLKIGPASVHAQIQKDVRIDPFASDFFDRFFASGMIAPQTRELNSEPLLLTAEPLPEGKPEGFSGSVGHFSISAAVDKTKARVGDAVNLSVSVQGTGNLKAIGDPRMPALDSFRVYDTVGSLNFDKKNDRVQGSKVFKTVLVPRVSGDLIIPPITFPYFDPQRRAYTTASTLPLRLKVEPGAPGSAPAVGFDSAGNVPQQLRAVSEDIRYLKAGQSKGRLTRALEFSAEARFPHIIPFLIFSCFLAVTKYRQMENANPLRSRSSRAWKTAARRIQEARQAMSSDPQRACGLMSEAFCGYLADRLGQSAAGLTWRRTQELLRAPQTRISPDLLERVRSVWEKLDGHRFAPGAGRAIGESISAQVPILKALLEDLEKEWRR
ncbi:MAG: hypothetical protein A3J74_03605 [Elusimicrobia bacterium RIFCSPHIGHO2_02_FULL_57_9]|nr:MAG: hypothetical protein A3J74_03605 [Elusimicrobia bacterium RIFCSPHIGHO2_02_FULL_57_9]